MHKVRSRLMIHFLASVFAHPTVTRVYAGSALRTEEGTPYVYL